MGAVLAGRYEILRELGRGGMGEVLLARQVNLGRLVVIKRVLTEHASEKHVRMLLDEAQIAARLHHPCIVAVLDVNSEANDAFIAMEYVAGVTLRELLVKAPDGLPPAVVLQIAFDVLRGLDYAHSVKSGEFVGVVHRDIKPRNIMVTFAGDTKLIDFGISRWLSGDGAWESTSVSGTHGYMAPEQQQGKRVDARADQYAVGITLREMFTGMSPRENEATLQANKPSPVRPTLPDALALIIDRACAQDADNRFADCTAFAEALHTYAKDNAISPSPTDVEKWVRQNLREKLEAWERDAKRASEPSLPQIVNSTVRTSKPVGEDSLAPGVIPRSGARTTKIDTELDPHVSPTSAATISAGERLTPPPTRKASERQRRRAVPIVAGAAAVVALGGGALWWKTHGTAAAPRPPSLVAVTAINEGDPTDAWIGIAIGHMAINEMSDVADRRFPLAHDNDARPARHVELAYKHTPSGIQIDARLSGHRDLIARGAAASVSEALDQLVPPLVKALGAGEPDPTPDDDERTQIAATGASSLAQYRKFRALSHEARLAGWIDSDTYAARFAELLKEDPTWAHPYGDLFWLHGGGTSPAGRQVLVDARKNIDPKRDPSGAKLIEASEDDRDGKHEDMAKVIEPVFEANDEDLLAGESLYAALSNTHRGDDARAVFRRLNEHHPDLYFVADIATALMEEGRDEQAEHVVVDALRTNPDNLTAAREVVRVHARRGEIDEAHREATRALLIHGEKPVALAELFEMMVLSGDLAEAQKLADRMLLGSPLSRARGRYRSAVIAVFEGRLNAATLATRQAIEAYGANVGEESEVAQCLMILRSIGDAETARDATSKFAELVAAQGDPETATVYRYRAALMEPGAKCPAVEPFLANLDDVDHDEARRDITRSAAAAGCAPCKDVMQIGYSTGEMSAESLIAHGDCAMKQHDPATARRAYEQATQLWSSWWSNEASPYFSILARFRLAQALHALGDDAGARREYERFLAAWGKSDREIAEVAVARRELEALGKR